MELSFVQSNIPWDSTEKPYEAIFMISGDAAIHIERERPGRIIMQQRTGLSGRFSEVNDFAGRYNGTLNIDHEIVGFVYPKEIRIISEVEPTFAAITFSSAGGNGGNSGGEASGEDVIFFDGKMLYEALGYDLTYVFNTIFGMSSFINKTTYYVENYAGRFPLSESTFQSMGDPSELSYMCVSNSLTPTIVMMGSGNVEIPKQDKPITVYEFFEILVGMGMELPVDVFKAAEVSREVVEQWMQG